MKHLSGWRDAASLLAIASGAAIATPWATTITPIAAGILAAAGTAGIAWSRLVDHLHKTDTESREDFTMPSDEVPTPCMGEGGLRFGYTKDRNLPLDIMNTITARHTAIIGQSGVGKTTLIEYILWQQTVRNGGWLFIDAKIDYETRDRLAYMAKAMGREDEFYVLDISNPDKSHTMNPILNGDPDEVASRLLNLVPSSESSPGSDFYRQSANHALTVIVAALQVSNKLYHFGDLAILLQSAKALEKLEQETPDGEEKRSLSVFLDQFRVPTKNGAVIDVNRLKQVLGGMSGRIATFAQGKFGKVFNVYAPEIVLESLILEGKMLYVSLPTMGKDTAALNLGKMIISDLRSAVANIQGMPKDKRPKIPFLAVLDEMGAYVMEGVARLFEQARSAGIALLPAFQSFSQLNRVSPDFADIVIQNTWNKILFKFGTSDGAEMAAELLGKEIHRQKSISVSGSESTGSQALRTRPDSNESEGGGVGISYREMEDFRISPDKIKSLGMGEVFAISGARVFHLRTPMLNYPKTIPTCEIARFTMRTPKGLSPLNYGDRLAEFLQQVVTSEEQAKFEKDEADKKESEAEKRRKLSEEKEAERAAEASKTTETLAAAITTLTKVVSSLPVANAQPVNQAVNQQVNQETPVTAQVAADKPDPKKEEFTPSKPEFTPEFTPVKPEVKPENVEIPPVKPEAAPEIKPKAEPKKKEKVTLVTKGENPLAKETFRVAFDDFD